MIYPAFTTAIRMRRPSLALASLLLLGLAACLPGAPREGSVQLDPRIAQGPLPPAPPSGWTEDAPSDRYALNSLSLGEPGAQATHYFHFKAPAAYRQDHSRAYPLVVYLHAWGYPNQKAELKDNEPLMPGTLRALLDGDAKHPAFVYVPVCPPPYRSDDANPLLEWNSPSARAMVVATIKQLCGRFNIDRSRIYFVGFSMGGSGSWYLAHAFRQATGSSVAAILRGSGWYLDQDKDREAIAASLATVPSWIHAGETEGDGLRVAQYSFDYFERVHARGPATSEERTVGKGLIESRSEDTRDGRYQALSSRFRVLPLKSGAELRLSVYQGRDHEDLMHRNADLLDWLFSWRYSGN